MPNQVEQSLRYLTGYLKDENARLEKEYEEKKLEQNIVSVSNKFKSLGPNSTAGDARSLMFEAIQQAAASGSTESIPMIQNLYGNQLQSIELQKKERQDAALAKGLTGKGIDATALGGQGLATLYQTQAQLNPGQAFEDEQGKSYLGTRRLNPETLQWEMDKSKGMLIKPTTRAEELGERMAFEKFKHGLQMEEIWARYHAEQRMAGRPQKTPYTVEMQLPGGKKAEVPLAFDPNTGLNFVATIDAKGKVQHVPYDPTTMQLGKYENPGMEENRLLNIDIKSGKIQDFGQKGAAQSLAEILRIAGSGKVVNDLFASGKLTENVGEAMKTKMLTVNEDTKENILWEQIRQMPPGAQKENAKLAYKTLKYEINAQPLPDYVAAESKIINQVFDDAINKIGKSVKLPTLRTRIAAILQQQGGQVDPKLSTEQLVGALTDEDFKKYFNSFQNVDKIRVVNGIK